MNIIIQKKYSLKKMQFTAMKVYNVMWDLKL